MVEHRNSAALLHQMTLLPTKAFMDIHQPSPPFDGISDGEEIDSDGVVLTNCAEDCPGNVALCSHASGDIPLNVVTCHILPFVADRRTWNAVALTCHEIFRAIEVPDKIGLTVEASHYGPTTAHQEQEGSKEWLSLYRCWPWPEKVHLPKPNDVGVVSCVALSSPSASESHSCRNGLSLMACGSFFRVDLYESRRGYIWSYENLQGVIKSLAFSSLRSSSTEVKHDNDVASSNLGCTFRYLVACSSGSNPRVWRISDEDCNRRMLGTRSDDIGMELRLREAGGGQPNEIMFSNDDDGSVLCLSQDHALWRCDVVTGHCQQVASLGVSRWLFKMLAVSCQFEYAALHTAESPDTVQLTRLHRGQGGGAALTEELVEGEPPFLLRHNADVVGDFAFSPCGRHAAMGGDHGIVQLWMNLDLGTQVLDDNHDGGGAPINRDGHEGVYRLRGLESHVTSVTFSPNGKWVAASDWSGLVRVWNIQDVVGGKEMSTICLDSINVHENPSNMATPISSLAFTPSSNMLVGTGNYGFVRFWNWPSFRDRIDGKHYSMQFCIS